MCAMHNGMCSVPAGQRGPVIAHFGFSCKNLSKLFNGSGGSSRSEILANIFVEGKGSTGSTFADIITALRVRPVPFIMFENVVELMKPDHMDVIVDAFQSVGMHARAAIFESVNYGLPQARKRVYGVACNAALAGLSGDEAASLADTVITYARALLDR